MEVKLQPEAMFFLVWWSQRDLRGRDDKSVLGSSCIPPPIATVAGHILVCCHCSSLIFGLRKMLTEVPSVSRICTHSMQKWNCDMSPSHSMTTFNLEPPKLSLKSGLFCHHVIIRLLRGCNGGHCPIGSISITHRADPKRLERMWPEFKKDAGRYLRI